MVGSCIDAGIQIPVAITTFSGGPFFLYQPKWLKGLVLATELRLTGATGSAAQTTMVTTLAPTGQITTVTTSTGSPGSTNLVTPELLHRIRENFLERKGIVNYWESVNFLLIDSLFFFAL